MRNRSGVRICITSMCMYLGNLVDSHTWPPTISSPGWESPQFTVGADWISTLETPTVDYCLERRNALLFVFQCRYGLIFMAGLAVPFYFLISVPTLLSSSLSTPCLPSTGTEAFSSVSWIAVVFDGTLEL